MSPRARRYLFFLGLAGMIAFYVWGLRGLPAFGHYRGPYGDIINAIAVGQTNATGVVSAINFDYRGFDTVGEEFILFVAATGVATVLREMRREREVEAADAASEMDVPTASEAVRMWALVLTGPTFVLGWLLTTHAQTNPSGGFQGGVVVATAFILIYLAGQYLALKRFSPVDLTDAVEAVGAAGFAAVGLGALATGAAYLTDVLPLGNAAGAIDSSGTIALISFFVGIEVSAAFVLIVSELLEQTLVIREGSRS
ncbi:MAG: MnhB domain-containing protein [Acidimicrobiales bacterium]